MNNLRRILSIAILLIAPLALFVARGGAKSPPHTKYIAFVGNYTNKTDSKGIYEFRFDAGSGKMSGLELAGAIKDPSWVVVHPSGKYLYAANEMGKGSTVSAFAIDHASGALTLLNQQPALGEDPCHLSFDRSGKFLLSANYTSGNVVVYPILADGKLGEHSATVKDQGVLGPNRERQDGPHAHWVQASQENSSVYVADLGLDEVLKYQFDSTKGSLTGPSRLSHFSNRQYDPSARLAQGTGPRHAAISRDGLRMYVLGELNSTVTAFHMMGTDDFVPASFQQVSMLPSGFTGRNDAAEIEIHPSGKFLYASNRGHDSIVAYAIEEKTGKLTQIEDVPTGGKEPRHFAIDPSGAFLLAENQNTNTIVEFRIDPATGRLTPTGETLTVPSPICLAFLPIE